MQLNQENLDQLAEQLINAVRLDYGTDAERALGWEEKKALLNKVLDSRPAPEDVALFMPFLRLFSHSLQELEDTFPQFAE